MGRNILVPVDNSESGWQALEYSFDHHADDKITALYVVDPLEGDYHPEGPRSEPTKRSEQIGEEARQRYDTADLDSTEFDYVTLQGKPAHEIVQYATEHDVDQIVMGSRGRSGMKRLLLGSVAETVVRRSPVPVNVVR